MYCFVKGRSQPANYKLQLIFRGCQNWIFFLILKVVNIAESSFWCRFRIESVNVFVLPRFDLCHVLSSSTTNFAHAQTLSRMSSLSDRMNIARVNIGFFNRFKNIKQWRISFVLGYLRMILWKISTTISNGFQNKRKPKKFKLLHYANYDLGVVWGIIYYFK
jgi:hypothetical protein